MQKFLSLSLKGTQFIAYAKNKKKALKIILTLLVILIFLLTLSSIMNLQPTAFAVENKTQEEIEKQFDKKYSDLLNKLNVDTFQKFLDSLTEKQRNAFGIDNIKQAMKSLAEGDSKNFFDSLIKFVTDSLGNYFIGFLPSFITVIILCLLKNILSGLSGNFLKNGTNEVVHIVCFSALTVVLATGITDIVGTVKDTVSGMQSFASGIFPVLLTLMSMLGSIKSVGVYQPFMAVLSGFVLKLIVSIVLPIFIAITVFSVVGHLTKSVKLDRLTKLLKSVGTWALGLVFSIFVSLLTVQGVTGGVADKLTFNAAKFAMSSYVPILGGYLSDGFDIFAASTLLIKNTFGYVSVIVLIGWIALPVCKLIVFMFMLRLTSAIAQPLGDSRVSDMMNTIADSMSLLITALIGAAFMFFLILMLLISTVGIGL